MILESLFPVFILMLIGNGLKHYGLTNDTFLKQADRLVYFVFFPALLFWKIGGTQTEAGANWPFYQAVVAATLLMFVLSVAYIKLFAVADFEAGTFSQSCYRFNTYIGLAIVLNALGDAGVREFGLLIGVIIPVVNVVAVSTLIWFSGQSYSWRARGRLTGRALLSNPLILACVAGIFYAQTINYFPPFVDNAFALFTSVTLPLALLSIGGALTFGSVRGYFSLSLAASLLKLLVYPLVGYACLQYFQVDGVAFQVGMIFFALPAATSIYVLSSQLNSNTQLASATIVLSTVLSFFALSVVLRL